MKKLRTLAVFVMIVATCGLFVGCTKSDGKYFERVSAYSFWDNTGAESIPQYRFYNIMKDFLSDAEIVNGNAIGKDGKIKKVAFIGWDGVRADALTNIFHDDNNFDTNNYTYASEFSGLNTLKKTGGLYLAYCGGEKGKITEQSTSTCAGWTSELTGVCNDVHGVKENNNPKNMERKTIMYEYAELGLSTSLAFDWGQYFDTTLKEEVKLIMQNNMSVRYCDIDRKKVATMDELMAQENNKKQSEVNAESIELYNAVANETVSDLTPYDIAMRDYLLNRIEMGDDIVGGIFHNPDTNGHTKDFSNDVASYVNSIRNSDQYLYQITEVLKAREANNNEEWLIITTADHGGSDSGHGKQIYEHRTIWMATNKVVKTEYYGKNYDGFKEN